MTLFDIFRQHDVFEDVLRRFYEAGGKSLFGEWLGGLALNHSLFFFNTFICIFESIFDFATSDVLIDDKER